MMQKNKEEYLEVDGYRWFCSGDIGQISQHGTLQIVDRKKVLNRYRFFEFCLVVVHAMAQLLRMTVVLPMLMCRSSLFCGTSKHVPCLSCMRNSLPRSKANLCSDHVS